MTRVVHFIFALSIFVLITACSRSLALFDDIIPEQKNVGVNYSDPSGESLKILYVTCGMLILQKGDEAIFFDPFFSYQPVMRIPFAVRSSEADFQKFKAFADTSIDRQTIRAGFISHSHYDHLMDLPLLLDKQYFPKLEKVYGSSFFQKMLYHHTKKGVDLEVLHDSQIFNPLHPGDLSTPIQATDSISVLPIASMHAPHKFGILMMNGNIDSAYFKKEKFKDPLARSRGFKWDTGCSYSFLVTFLNRDGSKFKVFVQTSASNEPYGLPPPEESADLAILCFASMQEVDDHPNYIMRKTKAKKLLLVHWEDFFREPKNPNAVKMVRGTNKKLAKRRLDDVRNSELRPEVIMPRPGSVIHVSY